MLFFQVKDAYSAVSLEGLLTTLERRGGTYEHRGKGSFALAVPFHLDWEPFFMTIRDSSAVDGVDEFPEVVKRYENAATLDHGAGI